MVIGPDEMPGARYAMNIVHPGSPLLRIRYRSGVLIDPYGFPDWLLLARALVDLPAPVPGLTVDEMRVVDVLAANLAMAGAGVDPLWSVAPGPALVATPPGWCWAHQGLTRRVALVPIELHSAFRHGGGVRTMPVGLARRGLRVDPLPAPVGTGPGDEVPEDILDDLERLLGGPLPATYRQYLADTNGAGPGTPGVLAGFGFIADQPLFGIARKDQHQDLAYSRDWLTDRFTPDLLPIGYVQGGVLAVGVAAPVADSVWYWDDDDARDSERFDAAHIRAHLLHRCADSFAEFWSALGRPAAALLELAAEQVSAGLARAVRADDAGAGLPSSMRAPWQAGPAKGRDTLADLFELS